MNKLLLAASLSLAALSSAQAAVVTINFDDLILESYDTLDTYTEAGFTFRLLRNSSALHFESDGFASLHAVDMEVTFGGRTFSLLSFDYIAGGARSEIVGSDGAIVTMFKKDYEDPIDFGVPIGLTDVTSAVFYTNGGFAEYFFFDNLVIETLASTVPEPASMALLGLGLAGLAVTSGTRKWRQGNRTDCA